LRNYYLGDTVRELPGVNSVESVDSDITITRVNSMESFKEDEPLIPAYNDLRKTSPSKDLRAKVMNALLQLGSDEVSDTNHS